MSEQEQHEDQEQVVDTAASDEHTDASIEASEVGQDTASEELVKLREDVVRAHAEMENIRRRSAREIDKARRFAQERILADLLPIVDSLAKATAADSEEEGALARMLEGNQLTLKMLEKLLKNAGLVEIDPVGEPFDPQLHEAMSMVPNPNMENNTVMDVWQKGYLLHDRVVRPAMVVVAQS